MSRTTLHHRIVIGITLVFITMIMLGCEFRRTATLHVVEYRSEPVCMPSPNACPWLQLEKAAETSVLVNCLLAGAVTLQNKQPKPGDSIEHVVTPVPPRYGYERRAVRGEGNSCPQSETICSVESRHDRNVTWASCGSSPAQSTAMRGGENLTDADSLADNTVVTGNLAQSTNEFRPSEGLDGPDHFYTFTLTQSSVVEASVAANSVYWTDIGPLSPSPWQPHLYLLTDGGETISHGQIFRAGVTTLPHKELAPGQYVLVVDSSTRELSRGDGIYRLYIGLDSSGSGARAQRHTPLPQN